MSLALTLSLTWLVLAATTLAVWSLDRAARRRHAQDESIVAPLPGPAGEYAARIAREGSAMMNGRREPGASASAVRRGQAHASRRLPIARR